MEHQIIIVVFVILLSMFIHDYLNKPVWTLCDTEKCPYCYGTDFCENIQMNNVILTHYNFHDIFSNYLSVKNVYKGVYRNESVVLKKLGHNSELDELDDSICVQNNLDRNCVLSDIIDTQNYEAKILDFLNENNKNEVKYFRTCTEDTSRLFLDRLISVNNIVARENYLKNVWTTLQMNVEPLVLQLFNENYPTPYLYGACGRLIVLKNAGNPLNTVYRHDWIERAYIAWQLLRAAKAFTDEHRDFHFYLTDISPDNIVVDANLKVTFIDLENIILMKKEMSGSFKKHQSEDLGVSEEYSYDEQSICNSSISDHNIFAVCKLLLSENAPSPMMKRGLLHTPPSSIREGFSNLFKLVKDCETPTSKVDRFQASDQIISVLERLLSEHKFEL